MTPIIRMTHMTRDHPVSLTARWLDDVHDDAIT